MTKAQTKPVKSNAKKAVKKTQMSREQMLALKANSRV